MPRLLVLLGLLLQGPACLRDPSVSCADGTLCPADRACDDAHGSCVAPEQLVACEGVAAGASCATETLVGACYDGVCLPTGCGNHIIDDGEACDDGNFEAGDGCSPDCRSAERCGNGVTDLGEACDDGGRVDRDGCDSGCRDEVVTAWRTGVAPPQGGAVVYDAGRRRLVMPAGLDMWEWDGQAWALLAASSDVRNVAAAYDAERGRVVTVGLRSDTLVLGDWDGVGWVERPTTGAPMAAAYAITRAFDAPDRHELLVVINAAMYAVDDVTSTWTALGAVANDPSSQATAVAYDPIRSRLVAIRPGAHPCCSAPTAPSTWEWDGVAWQQVGAGPAPDRGHVLQWDPTRQRLLAIGGVTIHEAFECCDQVDYHDTIEAWDGVSWTALPLSTFPLADYAGGWVDPVSGTPGLIDFAGHLWDLNSPVAVDRTPPHPRNITTIVADLGTDRVVAVAGDRTTWAFSDGWHLVVTPTALPGSGRGTHDPSRGGVVLAVASAGRTTLWRLADDWAPVADLGPINVTSVGYDYARRRLLFFDSGLGLWELPAGATTPRALPNPPSDLARGTLAFDASTGGMVGLGAGGQLYDLVEDTWVPTLSPGPGFWMVSSLRSGGVLFLPGRPGLAWRRSGMRWSSFLVEQHLGTSAVERLGGDLLEVFPGGVVGRGWRGVRQLEACGAGDEDGDGLVGCADRDCWGGCAPACPPTMSCSPS